MSNAKSRKTDYPSNRKARRTERQTLKLTTGRQCLLSLIKSHISRMSISARGKNYLLFLVSTRRGNRVLRVCARFGSFRSCRNEHSFLEWAQLAAFFKKNEDSYFFTDLSSDPLATARGVWEAAENRCRLFNLSGRAGFDPRLTRVKHEIWKLLGDTPDDSWLDRCYISSGAAVGVGARKTHLVARFTAEKTWSVTASALGYALKALQRTRLVANTSHSCDLSAPRLSSALFSIVPGNKLAYVPKTVDVLRPIAVEPLLNGFLQSGIDLTLRDFLRERWGIDLRFQEPNQRMARDGSIDGSYATIDLSSASDTISLELARYLLPYDWFVLLNDIRSQVTQIDSSIRRVEKFVSMGNNFCFPLQTIIFAAVCRSLGLEKACRDYRVYGDDIIVRSSKFHEVIEVLSLMGFVPNAKKTFNEGPFRESCGADWYNGKPVRPVFVRDCWDDATIVASFHNVALMRSSIEAEALFEMRNNFRRYVFRRPGNCCSWRLDGAAFNVELDEAMSDDNVTFNRQLHCWQWRERVTRPRLDASCQRYADYERLRGLLALYSISGSECTFTAHLPPPLRRETRTRIRLAVS